MCADGGSIGECPGTTCDGMLLAEWRSIIEQRRNYPCVFDYTMDNEHIGLHNAKQWRKQEELPGSP